LVDAIRELAAKHDRSITMQTEILLERALLIDQLIADADLPLPDLSREHSL
jgi:hypothetical protein